MRRIAVSARNSFAKFQLRMFEAPQPPFYNSLIKAQGNKCGMLDRLDLRARVRLQETPAGKLGPKKHLVKEPPKKEHLASKETRGNRRNTRRR